MSIRFALLLLLLSLPPAFAETPVVLVFGDSLSAGFGVPSGEGWVDRLGRRLAEHGYPHQVVNASVSGETTSGGRSRLPEALARHRPAVVILELGGNDGLRGLPLALIRANLAAMIAAAQEAGARVVLVGMRLPPNYGPAYTDRFHALYRELAGDHAVTLVPFLLEGVAGEANLMQGDGIHASAAAQARLLDNVWPQLAPLLTPGAAGTRATSPP